MIAVLGAGPHGREMFDVAVRCGLDPVFFDDDPDHGLRPVRDYCDVSFGPYVIGAAWPAVRRQVYEQVVGDEAATLIDPDATLVGTVTLHGGVVVAAGARVATFTVVGRHSHVNLNATISRGCDIGEFVTVCPGVNISGGCIVEDDVFIGVGAVVAHELVIGRGAMIGAGAVVVEDVKPFTTVKGNPAR